LVLPAFLQGEWLNSESVSWCVLHIGGDYFDRRNVEAQRTRLIRKLEALGVKVTVEALPEAA